VDRDAWNPTQYERFRDQRTRPFFDLLALVKKEPAMRAVDLGCGTGELTRTLHRELGAKETLGIDSSPAMLEKSPPFAGEGLRFELGEIESFQPEPRSFDLVFSNAALHWAPHHARLFGKLAEAIAEPGQLAVQMPANHHHASHVIAGEVARLPRFAEKLGEYVRQSPVLEPEEYAELLYELGFKEQRVRLEVYAHELESAEGVVEWVRGTTLTDYEKRLDAETYAEFLAEYRWRLLSGLSAGKPYLFPFKRILLWARK
jgi:trans-aconitate 2-methyltransferase